jgi:hypothetical protein
LNTARFQCSQLWGSSTVITLDMGRQLVGEKKAIAGRVEEFRLEWPGLPVRSVCGGAPCGRKAVTSNRGCIHAHAVNCHADHLQRNCQKKKLGNNYNNFILFASMLCNVSLQHPKRSSHVPKKSKQKSDVIRPSLPSYRPQAELVIMRGAEPQ